MRNLRSILFSLACSAVFAVALLVMWAGGRRDAPVARVTLSEIDVEKVSSLEIDRTLGNGDRERIALSKIGGRWRIDAPIKAAADDVEVKKLVDAVVLAEIGDVLSRADLEKLKRSLRDFGLAAPRITVTLSCMDRRETYSFGRRTASGGEVYVRQDGEGGVFTAPVGTAQALSRPLNGFRRHRLFSFSHDEIAGIALKDAGEPLSKLVKEKGSWRLAEPVDAPANRDVAESLLADICSERIVAYAGAGEGVGVGLGADESGYVLSLRNSLGVLEKAVLGQQSGTNEVWALTSEGAVVRVSASLLAACRKSQRTLEDTRVFPVDAQSVTSISVSEVFPAYMLSRKSPADPWRLVSPADAPADDASVGRLLERILAMRGVDITLGGTNAFIVSVGTGTTNFPSRTVSANWLLDGHRLADLRGKMLISYPPEKVKKVHVRTAAGVSWDASRYEALLKCVEKGIVAESVDAIAMSREDFRRCGFDRPSFTFSFELDDPSSAMRTLLLGAAAPGGGRYAMIGGLDDASFILSASTVSTLTKPVEETLEKNK